MIVSRSTPVLRAFSPQLPRRSAQRVPPANSTLETVEIIAFAATPFLAVQAFADSEAGKAVFDRLKERKPYLERQALETERARRQVRAEDPAVSKLYANPDAYPGDIGFDPFKLAKSEDLLDKYFEYELLHGRWAMLGALGAVIPEQLFPGDEKTVWWNVGYYKLTSGEDLNYFGVEGLHIAGNQGILVIAVAQVCVWTVSSHHWKSRSGNMIRVACSRKVKLH